MADIELTPSEAAARLDVVVNTLRELEDACCTCGRSAVHTIDRYSKKQVLFDRCNHELAELNRQLNRKEEDRTQISAENATKARRRNVLKDLKREESIRCSFGGGAVPYFEGLSCEGREGHRRQDELYTELAALNLSLGFKPEDRTKR